MFRGLEWERAIFEGSGLLRGKRADMFRSSGHRPSWDEGAAVGRTLLRGYVQIVTKCKLDLIYLNFA